MFPDWAEYLRCVGVGGICIVVSSLTQGSVLLTVTLPGSLLSIVGSGACWTASVYGCSCSVGVVGSTPEFVGYNPCTPAFAGCTPCLFNVFSRNSTMSGSSG